MSILSFFLLLFTLFFIYRKAQKMKNQLLNVSLILAAWALGVNAAPAASVEDVCGLLTSLSAEGKMVTRLAYQVSFKFILTTYLANQIQRCLFWRFHIRQKRRLSRSISCCRLLYWPRCHCEPKKPSNVCIRNQRFLVWPSWPYSQGRQS